MTAKEFLIANSDKISEAVENGYDIRLDEDEILGWMEKYKNSTHKEPLTYKEIKAKFGKTDDDFALIFGLKSKAAFANSSAFERYKAAVERLYILFSNCR